MAEPTVTFLGQDLWAQGYVEDLPNLTERKTFRRDKLISNEYDLIVDNSNNFFSMDNSKSLLNGEVWLYSPIVITGTSEETIWDGIVTKIIRNDDKAIIKSQNSFYKFRNQAIEYESSDWETGAHAFENICNLVGYTNIDSQSLERSKAILANNNCYIKVNINRSDDVEFQYAIEKIGIYSLADVYAHLNNIYFSVWDETDIFSVIELDESDLLTPPLNIQEENTEVINDFSLGYDGDLNIPITDSAGNNIGSASRSFYGTQSLNEADTSYGNQIRYKRKEAAQFVGEGYIKRTQKKISEVPLPLTRFNTAIPADHREWITLESKFRLTYEPEGWSSKLFEVFEYSINEDINRISLLAYEVEE